MSISAVIRIDADAAPHLPVGTGANVAVPKSNWSEEQYEHSSELAARKDSASSRS